MKMNRDDVINAYGNHIYPGKVEFYQKYDIVLVPEKREGCHIYDITGKRYFNCHCNGGVYNLGHRNPEVIRAVTDALNTYDIGNHHLISKPKAELGQKLAQSMPDGLNQVVYGVSGGEAIDLAIKLARGVTKREEIISAEGGYHGHTGFALAAGDTKFSEAFKPMSPGFKQVPFNDLDALKKTLSGNTAAVILETIPATLGIVTPEENYLLEIASQCNKHGALLILDEVQTGFGRTGKLWGFENYNVTPDIVVLGKGMSGGIYPITATVYHEKHKEFFMEDPFIHISTFGGSEVGCYAALKTLEISQDSAFLQHVTKMGSYFQENLQKIGKQYPQLGMKPRGLGLMMGLGFEDEAMALFMIKLLFDNGVYVVYSGNDPRVIQFLPVLNISEDEADQILEIIKSCCLELSGGKA